MSTPMHWAAPLIGLPWTPDGQGPKAFSCWGLVRWVFLHRHGVDMPPVLVGSIDETENVQAIKLAATRSGWRPAPDDVPADGDIVLMWGPKGRHVGYMTQTGSGLRLLHSDGYMTETRGPVGSVVATSLEEARAGGYRHFELWRLAA